MIKERSLVILKPDTIQRGLIGEILSRFEKKGLKMIAGKIMMATEEQCFEHYNKDDEWFKSKGENIVKDLKNANKSVEKEAIEYGKDIIGNLAYYITAGPVFVFVLEGLQAVDAVTRLVGTTEPTTADIGTIRGDLALDSYALCSIDRGVRNLIHCSESTEESEREIKIWFNENELIDYKLISEKMLYDVNLDGIKE